MWGRFKNDGSHDAARKAGRRVTNRREEAFFPDSR